jgi:hypothetical protein
MENANAIPSESAVHESYVRKYVSIYLVDRAYGGSEEGGWWYTYASPEGWTKVAESPADVTGYQEEAQELCDEWNKGRPDISSVLSQGQYKVSTEDHLPCAWPETKPHYE